MMVMLLVTALASVAALATRVVADPSGHHDHHHHHWRYHSGHRVPFTKKNPDQYNPVQRDWRRVTHLTSKTHPVGYSNLAEDTAELPLNNSGPFYEAKIGVGIPPTYYNLIVDTGSSNTWVGSKAKYMKTETSVNTSDLVRVVYGTGYFVGYLFNDTVTIAPGVTVSDQPIGAGFNTSNIPSDGILGIGPTDLTLGTLSYPHNTSTIPTVTDSLFAQGAIQQNLVAVSFEPPTSGSVENGELTFGAIDPTKYIGNISYSPITTNVNASKFWGINATIQYGGSSGSDSVGLTNTMLSGIVDTGTTLVYIPTAVYKKYVNATGGVLDSNKTGMLRITEAQYQNLQPLNFVIGGETFELTPNAQIWPRALNSVIGGDQNSIYLAVNELNNSRGIDFICGMAFLERFYSVFDSGNHSIGLAKTPFTNATTN